MKNLLGFMAVVMIIGATALYINQRSGFFASKATVSFGDVKVDAEVADNDDSQAKGLSGRKHLAKGQGMLFIFDEPGYYAFHMQDMKFPIDIIWLDESGKVVDITPNLNPDTYPQLFRPYKPAKYVLEVPAEFAANNYITVGDKAIIDLE